MLRRWTSLTWTEAAALLFLVGGISVVFWGFLSTQETWDLITFVQETYSNLGIELVSVALTVIVIEKLSRREAKQDRLDELLLELRITKGDRQHYAWWLIHHKGWIHDGTLRKAYIANVHFYDWPFHRAVLNRAKFYDVTFENARMYHANLSSAEFERCSIGDSEINDSVLKKTTFNGTKFDDIIFRESDLRGAVFLACEFNAVNFLNSNLLNASFEYTKRFVNVTLPDGTQTSDINDIVSFTRKPVISRIPPQGEVDRGIE